MNNFKRGQSSTKSLEVGMTHVYREMWNEKMPEWYNKINNWANHNNISYDWGKLDFETGIYHFYKISFDQEIEDVYQISLPDLLKSLKKREDDEHKLIMEQVKTEREKQKNLDKMNSAIADFRNQFKPTWTP